MREGITIGDYVLERKLSETDKPDVWKARHLLGNSVVIKFLFHVWEDPKLEYRLLNEKSTSSRRLRHPNIISIIEILTHERNIYSVEPYVDGENLAARLAQHVGPLNLQEVHKISQGVLSALQCCHSLGAIHGEVKPSNILLDRNGHVWLIEFGIARMLLFERTRPRDTEFTPRGIYTSPEDIQNPRTADARSDLYCYGCVLYEMLCGDPPFGSVGHGSNYEILAAQIHTPPTPPRQKNLAISAAVEQVILKCLEKDPKDRFASCGAASKALDAAIPG